MERISGKAWVFGDNINTDVIMPGQYLKLTAEEAAAHVMEGVDPDFPSKMQRGDIIIGGRNFGCGSSRESAPDALRLAGIGAVVSVFFARIFFRNAINVGLPAIECPQAVEIKEGDEIEIDLKHGMIYNKTQQTQYPITPYPPAILNILENGGLVNVLEKSLFSPKNDG